MPRNDDELFDAYYYAQSDPKEETQNDDDKCSYCGGQLVEGGYVDGVGDYGTEVCMQLECQRCGATSLVDCWDEDEDDPGLA